MELLSEIVTRCCWYKPHPLDLGGTIERVPFGRLAIWRPEEPSQNSGFLTIYDKGCKVASWPVSDRHLLPEPLQLKGIPDRRFTKLRASHPNAVVYQGISFPFLELAGFEVEAEPKLCGQFRGMCAESLVDTMYRGSQMFDYEASLSSLQGAFVMSGLLPVLPGPCSWYRFKSKSGENVLAKAAKSYFDVVHMPMPDQVGEAIAHGNTVIAEDRILAVTCVRDGPPGAFTSWEPKATFFFQAETDPFILLQQRRRWLNGTAFGYLWQKKAIEKNCCLTCGVNFRGRLLLYILVWCQLINTFLVTISPGVWCVALSALLDALTDTAFADEENRKRMRLACAVFQCIYFFIYVGFGWKHSALTGGPFHKWLYTVYLIFNGVMILSLTSATAYFSVVDYQKDHHFTWVTILVMSIFLSLWVCGLLATLCTALGDKKKCRAVLCCTTDSVIWNMLFSSLCFYLYLPTMVTTFTVYANARWWDLSWGNRPPGEPPSEKEKKDVERYHSKATATFAVTVIFNVALICIALSRSVEYQSQTELLTFGWVLFAIPAAQMAMSAFFWIVWYPIDRASHWIYRHCNRCFCPDDDGVNQPYIRMSLQ